MNISKNNDDIDDEFMDEKYVMKYSDNDNENIFLFINIVTKDKKCLKEDSYDFYRNTISDSLNIIKKNIYFFKKWKS